jgi:hypothetical protein
VLLPSRRRWAWHDRLISALAVEHEVAVVALTSPAYPLILRLWLNLSGRLFSGSAVPTRGGAAGAVAEADLVLDLSEGRAVPEGIPVLRPLYDGAADTMALAARLQQRQCPYLEIADERGAAVLASYAAIEDKAVLGRGFAQAFARVEALLLRAVAKQPSPLPPRPERRSRRFSGTLLMKAVARLVAGRLVRPFRRRSIRPGHWNIALRAEPPPGFDNFDLAGWRPIDPEPSTFHADPFILNEGGSIWLFAEACPYATGKGVIVCAQVSEAGETGPFRVVLEQPWHLSYPYLFRADGQIWLVPESSARGGIDIYRAEHFPDRWVLERRLFEDLRLVDATLFEEGGLLWLFAGAIGGNGGSSWDELFAWHAPGLAGPWTPHRLAPLKSDCRSARPGGRPLRLGERLLRPAQRCETGYGESLAWMEVRTLTPGAFEEVEVANWRGPADVSGLHSADLESDVQAVDFRADLRFSSDR